MIYLLQHNTVITAVTEPEGYEAPEGFRLLDLPEGVKPGSTLRQGNGDDLEVLDPSEEANVLPTPAPVVGGFLERGEVKEAYQKLPASTKAFVNLLIEALAL